MSALTAALQAHEVELEPAARRLESAKRMFSQHVLQNRLLRSLVDHCLEEAGETSAELASGLRLVELWRPVRVGDERTEGLLVGPNLSMPILTIYDSPGADRGMTVDRDGSEVFFAPSDELQRFDSEGSPMVAARVFIWGYYLLEAALEDYGIRFDPIRHTVELRSR